MISLAAASLLAAGLAVSSCYTSKSGTQSDAGSDPSPCQGAERCACYPNLTCLGSLVCLSNVCVNLQGDAGATWTNPTGSGGTLGGATVNDGATSIVGAGGTGVVGVGAGGTNGVAPDASTTGSPGTGGTGNTGSGGAGGGSGSGGTTGITTGAGGHGLGGASGSGGSSTSRGGASGTGGASATVYAGKLTTVAQNFTDGYATASAGATVWHGRAYSYAYGTATISPTCGETGDICYSSSGTHVCANGSVGADYKSGAGIGWSIAQGPDAGAVGTTAVTTGVAVQVKSYYSALLRVALISADTSPTTGDPIAYCVDVSTSQLGTGVSIPYSYFTTNCWTTGGIVYDPTDSTIRSIEISLPGDAAGSQSFDFCVASIAPLE